MEAETKNPLRVDGVTYFVSKSVVCENGWSILGSSKSELSRKFFVDEELISGEYKHLDIPELDNRDWFSQDIESIDIVTIKRVMALTIPNADTFAAKCISQKWIGDNTKVDDLADIIQDKWTALAAAPSWRRKK